MGYGVLFELGLLVVIGCILQVKLKISGLSPNIKETWPKLLLSLGCKKVELAIYLN